jgi:surface antigen
MFIRTTKPGKGDNYFIRKTSGGYSTCVKGKPTDKNCDVLANCVGYACGAYNEQLGLGYEKYHLNCNAENFIERAIASGLSIYKEPIVGGILVWQKGATLNGSDGAGHVAICIEKDGDTIRTAESGYGSSAFWTAKRTKGNGNWGSGSAYTYRGCIAPVGYKPEPKPEPIPEPPKPEPKPVVVEFKEGDSVIVNGVGTSGSDGSGRRTGNFKNRKMKIIAINKGAKNAYACNQYNEGKVRDYSKVTAWFSKDSLSK